VDVQALRANDEVPAVLEVCPGHVEEEAASRLGGAVWVLVAGVDVAGVGVDVAQPVVEQLVAVLVGPCLADHPDRRLAVALEQDHAGDEVGVEGEDVVVGQHVVGVIADVVHDEDVPWPFGQVLPALDPVAGTGEQAAERECALQPDLLRAGCWARARDRLVDRLELLVELEFPARPGQQVGTVPATENPNNLGS
jgi:hypothetical protein